MKNKIIIICIVYFVLQNLSISVFAVETNFEKAQTVENKAIDSVKKSYRYFDDKICETINGKMSCVTKKLKNKIKNKADQIKTESKDIINKVD